MSVYFVTGKLGSGKTLVAVGKIQDKIVQGCKIASNLDLRLYNMPRVGRMAKSPQVIRIPDKPSIEDLQLIGKGNDSYDELKNGLLVLDECGTWFNSRAWGDKTRQQVIDWFLHARKMGWDVIFLVQDLSIVDKQARLALAEHVVYCRRLDRISLPFIGTLYSLISGSKIPLPKVHLGIVKYGDTAQSMTVERWAYTGRDLYNAYDTKQAFSDNYEHGVYTYIPPYLTHGQFSVKRGLTYFMRMTKIYFRRMNRIFLILSFFALGATAMFWHQSRQLAPQVVTAQMVPAPQPPLVFTLDAYSLLHGQLSLSLVGNDGVIYSGRDLLRMGYSVDIRDACQFILKKGHEVQVVTC
ncbi:hypothetical protein DVQ78_19495 [Yersinia enterocolitica]|nr:hypothetical protein [Yersinia enterocolitica]